MRAVRPLSSARSDADFGDTQWVSVSPSGDGVFVVIGSVLMDPHAPLPDDAVGGTALAVNPYGYYDPGGRRST